MLQGFVYFKQLGIAADFTGAPFNHAGGRIVLEGDGTFGGGSLKLQFTTDADTTWIDVPPQNGAAVLLTANGSTAFFLPAIRLRVALAGSLTPAVNCFVGQAGFA